MSNEPYLQESLVNPGVAKLSPYQPGKPVSELARELGLSDVVKLASNENPLGASPAAHAAMQLSLAEVSRYPDGSAHELRTAIAEQLGVSMSGITLGNGSNDVLELIARAFLGAGREAIYAKHAFAVYPLVVQACGATGVEVPAGNGDSWPRYGHDLEAMAAAITDRTRVVFVANPNNPTGTYVGRDALYRFVSGLPEQIVCVIDEAYFEYVEAEDYPDATHWLSEFPNLVVTRTFSKAYGLASLRVGYAVSRPELADYLNRVRQPFNVNTVAQRAALAALGDREFVRQTVELNNRESRRLSKQLLDWGFSVIPSVGNFICVDVGRDASPVYEALLKQGVIVRPVANYGLPNHLRVSVGTESENSRFLEAIRQVLLND